MEAMVFFFFRKGASGSSGSAFRPAMTHWPFNPAPAAVVCVCASPKSGLTFSDGFLAVWNLKKWLRTAALLGVQLIRLIAANQTLTASAFRL
jgi:hypothetical protein